MRLRRRGVVGRMFFFLAPSKNRDETDLCRVVATIIFSGAFLGGALTILAVIVGVTLFGVFEFVRQVFAPVPVPSQAMLQGLVVVCVAVIAVVVWPVVLAVRWVLRTEIGRVCRAWLAAKKAKVCPRVEFVEDDP